MAFFARRTIAALLIAVQCAALAWMAGPRLFAATCAVLALLGIPGRIAFPLPTAWKRYGPYLLALLFFAKAQLLPHDQIAGSRVFLSYVYAFHIAQFFIALQVILLFVRSDKELSPYLPALGVVAMLYAGNKYVGASQILGYRILAILFCILIASYYAARPGPRRRHQEPPHDRPDWGRTALRGLALAAAALLTGSVSATLFSHQEDIRNLAQFLITAGNRVQVAAGFSTESRLDSISQWKTRDAAQVTLRVGSDAFPGYLRGRVFNEYHQGRWRDAAPRIDVAPLADPPEGLPRLEAETEIFHTAFRPPPDPPASAEWSTLDIQHVQRLRDCLFTPLGATHLQTRAETIQCTPNDTVEPARGNQEARYRVFVPRTLPPGALSDSHREECLKIPDSIDPRVRSTAAELFDGITTSARIAAVRSFFQTGFQYHLGVEIPKGEDPVGWFLQNKPPAHCEYFASAAVLLLRLGGVPSRYATGFVAAEKNPFGGYWVARNSNAHAWAEAWDAPRERWITVECTPAAGLPQNAAPRRSGLTDAVDAARFFFLRIKAAFQEGEVKALVRAAFETLWNLASALPRRHPLATLFTVLAILALWIRVRKHRRKKTAPPPDQATHLLLARMDAAARRRGWNRAPAETLHRFADRLEAMPPPQAGAPTDPAAAAFADWYRRFAVLHYSQRLGTPEIQRLESQARAVIREARKPRPPRPPGNPTRISTRRGDSAPPNVGSA